MSIADRLLALELAVAELQTAVRGRASPALSPPATETERLAQLLGNSRLAAVLARAGYATPELVAAAPDAALLAVDGIGDKALKLIREKVTP
jgi:predicted solute-binding protein